MQTERAREHKERQRKREGRSLEREETFAKTTVIMADKD